MFYLNQKLGTKHKISQRYNFIGFYFNPGYADYLNPHLIFSSYPGAEHGASRIHRGVQRVYVRGGYLRGV